MAKKKTTSAVGKKKKTIPARPKKRSSPQSKTERKATTKPSSQKILMDPSQIRLVGGKGSKDRGGGPQGHYWHIYAGETRAGHVYINEIDEHPFGKHASIQIQVNKTHQGRGIGKVAYRLACEESNHDVVIAHMRKNNVASQKAAFAAGFVVVVDPHITQCAMRWTRKR